MSEKYLYYIIAVFIIIFLMFLVYVVNIAKVYETNSKCYLKKNCTFIKNEYDEYNHKFYLVRKIYACAGKIVIEEK